MPDNPAPSPEKMIEELLAAGWTRYKPLGGTAYVSPDGYLFRGPAGAWKVMNAIRENLVPDGRAEGRRPPQ
jgi:hypothetical protein